MNESRVRELAEEIAKVIDSHDEYYTMLGMADPEASGTIPEQLREAVYELLEETSKESNE